MLIGVDFQPLHYGASGGIVQWLSGIFTAYACLFHDDQLAVFIPDDFPAFFPPLPTLQLFTGPRPKLHDYEAEFLRKNGGEILFRSYPHFDHPDFPAERQISFIPDMQHEERPEFFTADFLRSRRLGFGYLLAKGGAIGTMTEFSRQTILNNPWTACDDVFVAPPSVLQVDESSEADAPPWLSELTRFNRFFFFPANPWPHKNHKRLFEAFARAMPRLPSGTGLVLTGSSPEHLISAFAELPILHLGYVHQSHLRILYQRATALLFFSMYEGFGIPLLEAFHHGTPVICSNIPALSEVGGNAVLSCPPTDTEAMADLMVRIVGDRELASELVINGKERLKHYDWGKTAQIVRGATRRVASRATGKRPYEVRPANLSISVILNATGTCRSLQECIDALLAQTYSHFTVRILGSSALPRKAIASGDKRIRFKPSGGDAGAELADAVNNAASEINLVIRPDCHLDSQALAVIADHFATHPQCDVLACATRATTPDGTQSKWTIPIPTPELVNRDPTQSLNFTFEPEYLKQLSIDPRYLRPLVSWRRRIGAIARPSQGGLAVDFEHLLHLIAAGGAVDVLTDAIAIVAVTADKDEARHWAAVMNEVRAILVDRGQEPNGSFVRTLDARKEGREPHVGLPLPLTRTSLSPLRRFLRLLRKPDSF
jgi:glycosyltransferase involved in cell wall biosynthesis